MRPIRMLKYIIRSEKAHITSEAAGNGRAAFVAQDRRYHHSARNQVKHRPGNTMGSSTPLDSA